MEKQLNKQIETYLIQFKNDLRSKITELHLEDMQKVNEFVEYIYEYPRLQLEKEDVTKRKRIKNAIPVGNRCTGKLANGEQCTRRRKTECEFCGTHVKGIPNGAVQLDPDSQYSLQSMEVCAKEYSGIVYYVDKFNRVYKTEDVLSDKPNPLVIGTVIKRNGVELVEYNEHLYK